MKKKENRNILIPCNKKYYDIDGALEELETIDYRQLINVEIGATAYIYSCLPDSAIIYECEVIDINKQASLINDYKYFKEESNLNNQRYKYMTLKMVRKVNSINLKLNDLKDHGLTGIVQSQRYVNEELQKYLDSVLLNE